MTEAVELYKAGAAALVRRDFDQAQVFFSRASQLDPGSAENVIGLSLTASALGAHRLAKSHALSATSLRVDGGSVAVNVARRLSYFNEYSALVEFVENRLAENPLSPIQLAEIAVLLSGIGDQDNAMRLVDQALLADPKHVPSIYSKGNLLSFMGDAKGAELAYEHALSIDGGYLQASWMLSGLRLQTAQSNHIDRLRSQLVRCRAGSLGEAYLRYALHKELHDLTEYKLAWAELERANQVMRSLVNYRESESAMLIDELLRKFSERSLKVRSVVEQDCLPIFVVGLHRSGTTLLERMLSGHAELAAAGETYSFPEQLRHVVDHYARDAVDLTIAQKFSDSHLDAIATGYRRTVPWMAKGSRGYVEKLPANFLNVPMIAKCLPSAKIICIERDPMDVCFSNLRLLFSGVANYSYRQDELARFHCRYQALVKHWDLIASDVFMRIRYSDLVAEPEATLRHVMEFCGMTFQSGMLDVGIGKQAVSTASVASVRAGISPDRGGVWRNYSSWLEPLRSIVAEG
ncbi:sulfotransferase family protein [Xanthomonas citri pv. citri]|uniref:sulfotransferase n=1 Tax=Xanthomonas citri TaxID=346 RepID=UPI00174DCA68|nr:sulfotransferase [Xanthomonas citri]MBD4624468.1 sulfotransferase family protein [Xanthomonas citri pv. citri]